MRQASKRAPDSAEKTVRDIRRATRRHHSAEEKIRIVLEGLRGEDSIAELCRKEGINQNLYYRWSKEFLEAGKKRLARDMAREATSDEGQELNAEARQLKETPAEVLLGNYYRPGQLEQSIGEFVEYYNNRRYHESLDNLTPADVYFGRGPAILKRRETIKRKTIEQRRRLHQQASAA